MQPVIHAGSWVVDRQRSRVDFSVKHLMVATVSGELKEFEGVLESDRMGLTRASGVVHAASMTTGDAKRDEILRGADFFDVARHPDIHFASRRTEPGRTGSFRIVGDLTIKGATREVRLDGTISNPLDGSQPGDRIEVKVRGEISRREFGVTGTRVLEAAGAVVSDRVTLALEISGVRVSSAACSP